ncbi:Histone-lysine N-methyltransferase set-6 [Rhinocladiella similis]
MSQYPSITQNARPTSGHFEVRSTATSGRGVFALTDIPSETVLLETSLMAANTIYKPYTKEVCAQCFAYNRGIVWKIRDNARNVVFCSDSCQELWTATTPPAALVAREEIQRFLQRKQKLWNPEIEDFNKPSVEEIDKAWAAAEEKANLIRTALSSTIPTKAQTKAIRQAQSLHPDPDTLWFLLDAVTQSFRQGGILDLTADLAADPQPYINTEDLGFHVDAYLAMVAIVPGNVAGHVQHSLLRTIQSRTTHNSFGLRSLDEGADTGTAGSECFGFGVWPEASYWNHSCEPNLRKQRTGRTWTFSTNRPVKAGEELCISYLGGDERDMTTAERREKLQRIWGFECACVKCATST